jgi:hypothetical protein
MGSLLNSTLITSYKLSHAVNSKEKAPDDNTPGAVPWENLPITQRTYEPLTLEA